MVSLEHNLNSELDINEEESRDQRILDHEVAKELESQSSQPVAQTQSKKKHQIPKMYGVYLLNSLTKEQCFYVGSTPDPVRRLRQHNGELKCGGAYRTKKQGFRPWRIIFYVYGFPSKISALQFEHAWQHAYQTRHIAVEKRLNPGKRSTGSGTSLHGKLANCRLLLASDFFRRLGLSVVMFNAKVYNAWLKNRYNISIPADIRVDVMLKTEDLDDVVIRGGNYKQLRDFMSSAIEVIDKYISKCETVYDGGKTLQECLICKTSVGVVDNIKVLCICTFKDCDAVYHMDCLAKKFLSDAGEESQTLPRSGKCVKCQKVNSWNLLMRGTTYMQNKYSKKE